MKMTMKQMIKAVGTCAMVGALALGTTIVTNQTKAHAETPAATQGKITVSGQGAIKVKPDIAYIDGGVQTENTDAKKAQEENAKIMNAVLAALKAMGIAEEDIKTSNYYMYPKYDYSQNGKSEIVGYTVSNTVSVTVKALDKVGDIIDKMGEAGANVVNNVRFSLSDTSGYYEQALALAVKNAETKAKALAKAIDVTIDKPVEIVESGGYYAPVTYATAAPMAEGAADSRTSISSSELDVSCNITVVFQY